MLICNAAMVPSKSRRNDQGLEEMFVVNYLAKYLLVRLLIQNGAFGDIDKRGRFPRIIFVSSESHRNPTEFNWEGFGQHQEYGMSKTVEHYGYYKLLLTTFANELSRRLNDTKKNWSVFATCPGPVNTNIAREAPLWAQPLLKLIFRIFFRSPEAASAPILYLAASSDLEGITLEYLFLMNKKPMDQKATDPLNGSKLWELSEQLLSDHNIILTPFEELGL